MKVLSEALRSVLAEPFPGDKQGRSFAEVIALRVAMKAAKGDLRAVSEIADRTEGERDVNFSDASDLSLDAPFSAAAANDPYQRAIEASERLRKRIAARRALLAQQAEGKADASCSYPADLSAVPLSGEAANEIYQDAIEASERLVKRIALRRTLMAQQDSTSCSVWYRSCIGAPSGNSVGMPGQFGNGGKFR